MQDLTLGKEVAQEKNFYALFTGRGGEKFADLTLASWTPWSHSCWNWHVLVRWTLPAEMPVSVASKWMASLIALNLFGRQTESSCS